MEPLFSMTSRTKTHVHACTEEQSCGRQKEDNRLQTGQNLDRGLHPVILIKASLEDKTDTKISIADVWDGEI